MVTDSESNPLCMRSLRSMSGIVVLTSSIREEGVITDADAVDRLPNDPAKSSIVLLRLP